VYETPRTNEVIEYKKIKRFLEFTTHVLLLQKPGFQHEHQRNDIHHATMTDDTTSLNRLIILISGGLTTQTVRQDENSA
jgi:hypothetical protein